MVTFDRVGIGTVSDEFGCEKSIFVRCHINLSITSYEIVTCTVAELEFFCHYVSCNILEMVSGG